MTTIAAAVHRGVIVMAGDTRVTEPETGKLWDSDLVPKVAVRNNIIYGVAGDKHVVNHIILGWEPPRYDISDTVLFVHTVLHPHIVEHVGDMEGEWSMLVGVGGLLFYVNNKDATHDGNHGTAAVGSGAAYALGYMQTPRVFENSARWAVAMAVSVAAEFDIHTSTDSTVVELVFDASN